MLVSSTTYGSCLNVSRQVALKAAFVIQLTGAARPYTAISYGRTAMATSSPADSASASTTKRLRYAPLARTRPHKTTRLFTVSTPLAEFASSQNVAC